jgi:DNA repair protein RecO (recombination protein O)
MALHKDEAIVLFKRAYGESDKIIRLFTLKSGKIAAIAKGGGKSQKRFMNTLEPFNHINVEYFEKSAKGLVRIENADIIETNCGIETSLKKACTAGFFTELVDRLTKERERHDALFLMLKEVLQQTKSTEPTYAGILRHHLKILEALGFMPNFNTCVHCGNKMDDEEKLYFSRQKGGILCLSCSSLLPHKAYRTGVIEKMLLFRKRKEETEEISFDYKLFERDIQDIMEGFMSYHLDVEFRSYRLLKSFVFK